MILQRPASLFLCLMFVGLFFVACSHSQVQVLDGMPQTPIHTLGMVSGHGPNEASALEMVVDQAQRLEAEAVVIERTRTVGSQVVITARAITYLAPPPESAQ